MIRLRNPRSSDWRSLIERYFTTSNSNHGSHVKPLEPLQRSRRPYPPIVWAFPGSDSNACLETVLLHGLKLCFYIHSACCLIRYISSHRTCFFQLVFPQSCVVNQLETQQPRAPYYPRNSNSGLNDLIPLRRALPYFTNVCLLRASNPHSLTIPSHVDIPEVPKLGKRKASDKHIRPEKKIMTVSEDHND